MYADRVAAGTKRSIKERLEGDIEDDLGPLQKPVLKRQRQVDDKWKHDLYEGDRESPSSIGPKDLRLKLQRKVPQQTLQSGKAAGVRDLREKLSGIMHSQAANIDPPKAKAAPESSIPANKSATSVEASVQETKNISNPTYSEKKAKRKSEFSVEGFLQSLGLEKYIITFKVEEVDMAALMHMTEADLKALGVPMGPRKKILRALESSS
ncbi:ankyrin repeat and SAM domain-containing protein 6 isoform X2 [Phalaenopsis equestris]|uniref:ankyrin repeat and SAM domain-containing protein 6 isoform X2 n=1 Tax=Phalaenopsis equestris TaxID=78828 RepID=UPI0009E272A3|nr:ankyrin repeat and SAM domain-containing protein 6 isoform X2 [Phalaenopsis equestris]